MKKLLFPFVTFLCVLVSCGGSKGPSVTIVVPDDANSRMKFGAEQLRSELQKQGCRLVEQEAELVIRLSQASPTDSLPKEGFHIVTSGGVTQVIGNDATGSLYGCRELIDNYISKGNFQFPADFADAPEMVLRGPCIGVQKTQFLPGRAVYEYPYTPENFPWFYDKEMWLRYLDMMVENRMNSLYLWNGHPFASLVKLEDYPFAVEVDDATFAKNREIFSFLTTEAEKRGI